MKQFLTAITFTAITCSPAVAETNWKDEAAKEIQTLQDVVEAKWADSGALWLSTLRSDDDLPIYTEVAVCPQMAFAGKPPGEEVLVRWFSAQAMTQNKLERVSSAWCP